ncbi:hypothetical protein H7X46_23480 [Pseudonocardia sp. C8]|uniref:Uncharacterized protein n=1 Tax=Saccharopolyspora cebuensis TaxID=418759 RepID=A0ABV4CN61_9PSEU|nr:hypothetical protein [Pseudonocardia sp. C8]MBC3194021.1 hypothetical protein [Pseudonocardia sp. C8]
MSSTQAVAATLRAVLPQIPNDVVSRLDDDLATVTDLLSETLTTSTRHPEVIGQASQLRAGLIESLRSLLGVVEQAISDKAAALACDSEPAGPALPAEVSRKVQELRGKPPPKTPNKETNQYVREITSQGWAVEKTGGNHLKVWGPNGEGPFVFSSTPSSATSNRKLRALRDQIRRKDSTE